MAKCSPIYYKKEMGKWFCKGDFFKYVEKTFVRAIKRYRLINRGEKVAVAVSGGKDSMTLLYLMDKIERRNFDVDLVVVHLDEGIKGYSDIARERVREFANLLGIEVLEASYRELFNFTIDQVAKLDKEVRVYEPCSYCGVWRRWGINYLALKTNADKVATAHTMDDEAQTVIINVLRGGLENLLRMDLYPTKKEGFVPRIKPFRLLLEKETSLYAILKNIPYVDVTCPYASLGMRWDIRFWLYEQEDKYPGTLRHILSFEEKLIEIGRNLENKRPLGKCKICGLPATKDLCRAHELQFFLKERL
ncbi:MAG: TIGR00269 family protein [Candidatus Njordarchaeia archaeon]